LRKHKYILVVLLCSLILFSFRYFVAAAPGAFVNLCGTSPPSGNWAQHNANSQCIGCVEGNGCFGTVVGLCVCDCGEEFSNIECRANCRSIGGGATFASTFDDDCLMYQMDVYTNTLFGTLADFATWRGDRFCDPSCIPQTPTPTPAITITPTPVLTVTSVVTPTITPITIPVWVPTLTPVMSTPYIIPTVVPAPYPLPKTNLLSSQVSAYILAVVLVLLGILIYKFEIISNYNYFIKKFENSFIGSFIFRYKGLNLRRYIKKTREKFEKNEKR
jgi:hypothetical protein